MDTDITNFGRKSLVTHRTSLIERIKGAENRPYWKCTKCGLELTFEEVCKSGGHNCEEDK